MQPEQQQRERALLLLMGVSALGALFFLGVYPLVRQGGGTSTAPPGHSAPAPGAAPQPAAGGSLLSPELPAGWQETPSEREQPEIVVVDETQDRSPFTVVFRSGGNVYSLRSAETDRLSLPAGEYQYEFQATYYAATGQPDQSGRFVCKRFRRYTVHVVQGTGGPHREDIGDP